MTNPNAPGLIEEDTGVATPDDVAALYSWANLEGARYRDFSASRREYRARVRLRAAGALHQTELRAKAEAEQAAADAERSAQEAERRARTPHGYESSMERNRALRSAEAAARRAAAERTEAENRGAAAALAATAGRREEREIVEAQASVVRQAAHWTAWQSRSRELAGPQPVRSAPRLPSDPYQYASSSSAQSDFFLPSAQLQYTQMLYNQKIIAGEPEAGPREGTPSSGSPLQYAGRPSPCVEKPLPETHFTRMGDPVFTHLAGRHTTSQALPQLPFERHASQHVEQLGSSMTPANRSGLGRTLPAEGSAPHPSIRVEEVRQLEARDAASPSDQFAEEGDPSTEPDAPAWLADQLLAAPSALPETLAGSQPSHMARWSSLHSAFGSEDAVAVRPLQRLAEPSRPTSICVFSPLGGAGKTCMVATLGRALAALGERVLLADTSALSLLPFYFGLAAPPPDELLLIPPLATAFEEPLQLVTYQLGGGEIGGSTRQRLVESLVRDSRAAHLILIDLDASPADLLAARQDLPGPLVLLIPLAPDMKSVLALQAIEAMLGNSAAAARSPAGASGSADRADGSAPTTHYVLTQFDPTQSLHVDVREVLRARLGDRLLPLTISRASAVAEALAEGMTILEYAPASAVAEEYRQLAAWLHRAAFAGQAAEADERRSED